MLSTLFHLLRSLVISRLALATEILALRQQLAILNRTVPRPTLRRRDRLFWPVLSNLWSKWREALVIIKPMTVITWHHQGFRLCWKWKSRARHVGRPKIAAEIRELIRRMSRENPLRGVPRIQAEQQMIEAFPEDSAPRFLLWDRDSIYGAEFRNQVKGLLIEEVITAPRAPFQNAYGSNIDSARKKYFSDSTT